MLEDGAIAFRLPVGATDLAIVENVETDYGAHTTSYPMGRARLKRDGTRAETRFGLLAKWTSPFKLGGVGVSSVDYWQPRCAHQQ